MAARSRKAAGSRIQGEYRGPRHKPEGSGLLFGP